MGPIISFSFKSLIPQINHPSSSLYTILQWRLVTSRSFCECVRSSSLSFDELFSTSTFINLLISEQIYLLPCQSTLFKTSINSIIFNVFQSICFTYVSPVCARFRIHNDSNFTNFIKSSSI